MTGPELKSTVYLLPEVAWRQPEAPQQADVRSHSSRIVNRLGTLCDMCGI